MCIDAKSECRFWAKVDRSHGNDACWNWLAGRDKDGYGSFKAHGRQWRAHRIAFMLTNGPIESMTVIRHKCDNRPCCNPAHLLSGTNADNVRDKCERGRQVRGETDGNSKLTARAVATILHSRESNAELARRYGVTAANIGAIRLGKTWAHVGRAPVKYRDGRFGEDGANSKLTSADVIEILTCDINQPALARKFGVNQATISNIRHGKYWKDVYAEVHHIGA